MEKEFRISYTELAGKNELDQIDHDLVKRAEEALKHAYADYSRFYVGAAVLLENGVIITGNNQENVAYPSGICAERVALFYASSQYPNVKIKTIAVMAKSIKFSPQMPVSPCGSCRQVITEYEQKYTSPIKIIMASEDGKIIITNNAKSLLPFVFEASLKS
jgi:cytidine deaminase